MAAHPLDTLGFEPIPFSAQRSPRSLADLGFETVTDTVGAHAKAAARKTARDPQLLAGMQQMIVRPQAAGAVEPDSGRTIVQPTDNPAINQALATEAMPAYKVRLLQAIRHIPGARLAASRDAKNPARLAEKIAGQGQPAETVSDYGAAQIAVASPEAKDAVVAAVKRNFPVLRQQDNFTFGDPEYRYRSYSLQVQMPMDRLRSCRSSLRKCWRQTGRSITITRRCATRSSRAGPPIRHGRPRGPSTIPLWNGLTLEMASQIQW
jgi:hypothetical protein